MMVRPIFAWYDLWVGVYVDVNRRRVYVFPIPCLGLVIEIDALRKFLARMGSRRP